MTKALVSIIIPFYNAASFLSQTIQSALDQTWSSIEIILVDDGSTDESLEIAKKIKSNKIIVIQQKNSGASAARNSGLLHAKGEYIQFLDADDLLSPTKIELQMEQLVDENNAISFGTCVHFKNGTSHTKGVLSEHIGFNENELPITFVKKLYGGYSSIPAGMVEIHSWLCPRSVIEMAGQWNEKLTVDDDGEFFLRVILNASKIKYCQEAILFYRKHETASLSNSSGLSNIISAITALKLKSSHLLKYNDDFVLKKIISQYFWQLSVRTYPEHKLMSKKCAEHATAILEKKQMPKLDIGNKILNFIANQLSWKLARTIQFYKKKI